MQPDDTGAHGAVAGLSAPSAVAKLLDDCAAASDSWLRLGLKCSERSGTPLMRDREPTPTALSAALDGVYYALTFDEDGGRKVMLRPKHEAADSTWPESVDQAPPDLVHLWRELSRLVKDRAVRARLRHLLFQAKADRPRDHALAAIDDYLAAVDDQWTASDRLTYAHAALRLSVAMGDEARLIDAANAVRRVVEDSLRDQKPGVAQRGLVVLAGVRSLPFSFPELAQSVLPALGARLGDRVLAAMIKHAGQEEREVLWRRRVDAAVAEAQATSDALVRTSRFTDALRIAERSGIRDLRRSVAALLQKSARRPAQMMTLSTVTRWYTDELEATADALIGREGTGAGLIRWAKAGPFTGDAAANRDLTQHLLQGSLLWILMPRMLLDQDHLPRYTAPTEDERFEVELVDHETRILAQSQPLMALALEQLGQRDNLLSQNQLYGFLRTWPGLDDGAAYMVASALLRYWMRDFDGAFYIAIPLVERTIRHLVLAADEGIYRLQKDQRPGQFPGVGALLEPLARLYDLDESWQRYFHVTVVHPAGVNLRNLAAHGLMVTVHRDVAALALHLVLHLGTLQRLDERPKSETTPSA